MKEKQDIFTIMDGRVKFLRGIYNPTSDAVWLAAFAKSAKTVLDVGVGTGGVSLCYAHHNPGAKILGIDISGPRLDSARDNAKLNNYDLELLDADILTWRTDRTFDLVMTNPPYFIGTPALHDAHHNINIGDWISRCAARVRPRGYFCMIIDADLMGTAISALPKNFGDLTIVPLFGAKKTAKRVLISARLGVGTGTRLYPGLSMNDENVLRGGLTISDVFATLGANV